MSSEKANQNSQKTCLVKKLNVVCSEDLAQEGIDSVIIRGMTTKEQGGSSTTCAQIEVNRSDSCDLMKRIKLSQYLPTCQVYTYKHVGCNTLYIPRRLHLVG